MNLNFAKFHHLIQFLTKTISENNMLFCTEQTYTKEAHYYIQKRMMLSLRFTVRPPSPHPYLNFDK